MNIIIIVILLIAWVCTISLWKRRSVDTDQKLVQIKDKITMVDPRIEQLNFHVNDTEAFILDKKDIHICLKDKNGDYHDDNFLVYIALHEVAHALIPSDTTKHPPVFEDTFNKLLHKATALRIYSPHIPFPTEYCRKELSSYYY
jgi:hypothetical protein